MDYFEETIPMSTYLVAYIVCDFKYVTDSTEGFDFGLWARPDVMSQVDYALHFGPKVLKFFEEYFDVPFPLPKMDMVAIPDFGAGAMENWGELKMTFSISLPTSQKHVYYYCALVPELKNMQFFIENTPNIHRNTRK